MCPVARILARIAAVGAAEVALLGDAQYEHIHIRHRREVFKRLERPDIIVIRHDIRYDFARAPQIGIDIMSGRLDVHYCSFKVQVLRFKQILF